jgi:L,D-transpeptidase catalytic domain
MSRFRQVYYAIIASLITLICFSGCGASASAVSKPTPTSTVTYQSPTAVPFTPTASPTDSPTALPVTSSPPRPPVGGSSASGQMILVSVGQQWLWAYQDGKQVFDTPVTTGMPELPTPTGTYSVLSKGTNLTFISPWPPGSPYYYSPEHVNYAFYFLKGGYYIHDAPWRKLFGPGTNVPHTDPDGTQETGSHGCINVPTSAGAWLYNWVKVGTTIKITSSAPAPTPTTEPPTPTVVPPTPTVALPTPTTEPPTPTMEPPMPTPSS